MAEYNVKEMNFRLPVIVILGATGTGKSKLGIEIARRFGGEIISGDSMQVYKGLDIVTNKVTEEERRLAPHHMLDIVEPLQRFTVLDFRNRALPIIEDLLKMGKLPIIVGGTNYYIESLLWRVLLEDISGKLKEEKDSLNMPHMSEYDKIKKPPESECVSSVNFISGNKDSNILVQNFQPFVKAGQDIGPNVLGNSRSSVLQCVSGGSDKSVHNVKSSDESVGISGKCDELVYEKDKKRQFETSGEVQRKRIKLDNEEIDIMNEEVVERIPSLKLYEKLKAVDPDMADQLHPNNKRKIIRSLQVFVQMGRRHSEILREQRSAEGGSELGGPLRYPHSCILWLKCDQEVLDNRLDSRVDTMLQQGLIQELLNFHSLYNKQRLAGNIDPDYTKGIFQSIGFKEFHEYLMLSPDKRETQEGSRLFRLSVDALKLVTRRYARRQIRWINNRFLRRPTRQVPPVYGLDTTNPALWNEHVFEPAVQILESMLKGERPSYIKPLPIIQRGMMDEIRTHYCEVCERTFVGVIQWRDHMNSKKHYRVLNRKNMVAKPVLYQ